MANSATSNSKGLKINEELKIHEKNDEISADVMCNMKTPLLLSSCNSVGSCSGSFKQYSVNNCSNSSVNEFIPKVGESESSLLSSNELLEYNAKWKISQSNSRTQEIDQEMQSDIHDKNTKKFRSLQKITILDNNSYPYDIDFKKTHFLSCSVFEDNIAAFKDESSPNLLSTTASSLSSLTIDDDEYNDNMKPNKARLVKSKLNIIDSSQVPKLHVQDYWRQDPIGSACKPSKISKSIETKQIFNNQSDNFLHESLEKEDITNEKLNMYSCRDFCRNQEECNKRIVWTGCNISGTKKSNRNSTIYEYFKNSSQNICREAEGSTEETNFRKELHVKNMQRDKLNNIYQENQIFTNCHKADPKNFDNKFNSINSCKRYKHEFSEQDRCLYESYQHNNEISHSVDENNELNAYEEQLLDQCIRRGMAKVTKRNISDIKPFCWDLNQICLTTRAMLKIHNENIMRERQEEWYKRRFFYRED